MAKTTTSSRRWYKPSNVRGWSKAYSQAELYSFSTEADSNKEKSDRFDTLLDINRTTGMTKAEYVEFKELCATLASDRKELESLS